MLVLHGSDGVRRDELAQRFADAGFSALAITYFGAAGSPAGLVEVPVEGVGSAARWLTQRTGSPIVVAGHSKGAELGLIAASLLDFPFGGAIGWAPSSVAWYGVDVADPTSLQRSKWSHSRQRGSWSHLGKPVPFVPYPAGILPEQTPQGLVTRPCFEAPLDDYPEAAIAIESACPTLLISGGDDHMWPSRRMGDMLIERAGSRQGPPVQHLVFDDAGHLITPDRAGRTSELFRLGGTPEADRAAAAAAFTACIEFLGSL